MDTKKVDHFLIVCQYLNISKAADFIGISQSALSREIHAIERKIGVKLFFRQQRGLKLTTEGTMYLESMKNISNEMKVLRKNIKQLNTEIHGNFILSMHSLFAQNVVSKIEKELLGFDSITVDYRFEQSSEAIHGVLNGSTDMAIVTKVQEAEGLMKIELKDEYIGLYSNTGQKEAQLIYNENMVYANQCLTQYGQFKRQIGNYQVLKSVLQQGGFMGLLPSSIAETDRSLKLIEKSLTGIKVYLVYREDRSLTAGFSKIIETIKQIFSNGRLQ